MQRRWALLAGILLACMFGVPALALGPLDGEVGAVYWANDFEAGGLSTDSAAPGIRAELWMVKKYGLRAGMYQSDLGDIGGDNADYMSIDLMWKAFSPTENNFLAVGLGWQDTDYSDLGFDGSTTGLRLNAEGRVGIVGAVYFYGQAAYMPAMDDTPDVNPLNGSFEDIEGMEYELGVSWKAAPFVSVRAGYRNSELDFTQNSVGGSTESNGFLVGLGFHF